MICPACTHDDTAPLLCREAVPVHQNRVHPTLAAARAAPTGTLDLWTCARCGHGWNAAFDPDRVDYATGYDNRQEHSPAFAAYLEELVGDLVAGGVRDCDVVEVGCGWGHVLRRLCAAGGNRGVGFDPAYRGPLEHGPVRFVRAFYGPDQSHVPADVVLCRHVIEHVPDPHALVAAVAAALRGRPHARVLFECPDARWIVDHRVTWDVFYEHAHYFTPASLAAVFVRAGLTPSRHRTSFGGQYQILEALPSGGRAAQLPAAVPDWRAWAAAVIRDEARWRAQLSTLAREGPVVLWGAGAKGVTLAGRADPEGSRLAGLVDVNPGKQGGHVPVSGHPILAPAALPVLEPAHVVVLNPAYLPEIRAHVRRLGLDVPVHPPELPCASSSTTKLAS